MTELYPEIRLAHILAVMASGGLFFLRGLAVRAGHGDWALAPAVRYLSYAIDTFLLVAALVLVAILPSAVFAGGWLAVKLALLPLYVVLGWLALRRSGHGARQTAYYAGALLVYGLMVAIARTHDSLGPVHLLTGA